MLYLAPERRVDVGHVCEAVDVPHVAEAFLRSLVIVDQPSVNLLHKKGSYTAVFFFSAERQSVVFSREDQEWPVGREDRTEVLCHVNVDPGTKIVWGFVTNVFLETKTKFRTF